MKFAMFCYTRVFDLPLSNFQVKTPFQGKSSLNVQIVYPCKLKQMTFALPVICLEDIFVIIKK